MTQPRTNEFFRSPLHRPLALGLALAATAFVLMRSAPGMIPWNLIPLGALALFCAARMRGWSAFTLPVALRLVTDLIIWWQWNYLYPPFEPTSYVALGLTLVLGMALLRRTANPFAVGGVALASAVCFFLITNFGAWAGHALAYSRDLNGLMAAYSAGLPFFRTTLAADLIGTGILFGLHSALAPSLSPSERPVPVGAYA